MQNLKKKCIAMLLAGGQGSRLTVLTEKTAKPAVPFGGKYRIIDFPLSNCVNSGIDTVGIMTQYQPLELNEYIGNGKPWGLNSNFGGVHILPPYSRSKKSEWYKGTANAVYQNRYFIDRYNPDYVLVLSGDQIYKMNFSGMIDFHKKSDAECTIAVFDVPISEASRFGIMSCDENGKIFQFEEKPQKPKSTLASMGIYIFNWKLLRKYLKEDSKDLSSANDFGKNIIPNYLKDGRKLYAYKFNGYWRDVGTIESLWEANMDLLTKAGGVGLKDEKFRIYSRNYAHPPAFVSSKGKAINSLVTEGCIVDGTVENSILSVGCTVEEGAVVKDSVIMPGAIISKNAFVLRAVIGEKSNIKENVKIGSENGVYVVGTRKVLEENFQ